MKFHLKFLFSRWIQCMAPIFMILTGLISPTLWAAPDALRVHNQTQEVVNTIIWGENYGIAVRPGDRDINWHAIELLCTRNGEVQTECNAVVVVNPKKTNEVIIGRGTMNTETGALTVTSSTNDYLITVNGIAEITVSYTKPSFYSFLIKKKP